MEKDSSAKSWIRPLFAGESKEGGWKAIAHTTGVLLIRAVVTVALTILAFRGLLSQQPSCPDGEDCSHTDEALPSRYLFVLYVRNPPLDLHFLTFEISVETHTQRPDTTSPMSRSHPSTTPWAIRHSLEVCLFQPRVIRGSANQGNSKIIRRQDLGRHSSRKVEGHSRVRFRRRRKRRQRHANQSGR